MQWDPSATGGFTTATPWLPLVDAATRNVADQARDPGSLLSLYRRLIAARRRSRALGRGTHRSIFGVAPDVLAWVREAEGERVLVLLNLADETRDCDVGDLGVPGGTVVVGTGTRHGAVGLDGLRLEPLEGLALGI
jgi:glycosidase